MYLVILLSFLIIVYFLTLQKEHFMPMDTFETRMPCLINERYAYDDKPRPESNYAIINQEYANLYELPISYDPTKL